MEYNSRDYLYENWFVHFTTTLSVNSPYEPMDTVLSSLESGDLMMNPVFERHLTEIGELKYGRGFCEGVPGVDRHISIEN